MAARRRIPLPGADLLAALGDLVPADQAAQAQAEDYIGRLVACGPRVCDLGCGVGGSVDLFRAARADVAWVGADIAVSAEVGERVRDDAEFVTFDGVSLPFADAALDAIYCKQVLEHVEDPRALIADAARVLRPGGLFAGSTSQLEPFHSMSTFGYTPHGLTVLLRDAGLEVLEVRPGIDALTLMARRALRRSRRLDRYFGVESPLNRAIDLAGRVARADPRAVAGAKLVFAGQFCVLARKPG